MTVKLNYNEFLAFVLLYASHVDMEYSDAEKEAIQQLVSEQSYEKVYDIFNEMSDFAALQTIIDHKGIYYPTADQRAELLAKIEELFYADGDYSIMEKELMQFLDKLL